MRLTLHKCISMHHACMQNAFHLGDWSCFEVFCIKTEPLKLNEYKAHQCINTMQNIVWNSTVLQKLLFNMLANVTQTYPNKMWDHTFSWLCKQQNYAKLSHSPDNMQHVSIIKPKRVCLNPRVDVFFTSMFCTRTGTHPNLRVFWRYSLGLCFHKSEVHKFTS